MCSLHHYLIFFCICPWHKKTNSFSQTVLINSSFTPSETRQSSFSHSWQLCLVIKMKRKTSEDWIKYFTLFYKNILSLKMERSKWVMLGRCWALFQICQNAWENFKCCEILLLVFLKKIMSNKKMLSNNNLNI